MKAAPVVWGLLACAFMARTAPAQAESLIVSLSTSRVLISSNYTGSSVVLFGTIERDAQTVSRSGDYQLVVTVRGASQTITVREKRPVGPIWVNRAEQTFEAVPAYLAVLASAPIDDVTTEPLRRRLRIGLEAMLAERSAGDETRFRDALLRIEQRQGLYLQDERGVSFLTRNVFRAPIPMPATAPPGQLRRRDRLVRRQRPLVARPYQLRARQDRLRAARRGAGPRLVGALWRRHGRHRPVVRLAGERRLPPGLMPVKH